MYVFPATALRAGSCWEVYPRTFVVSCMPAKVGVLFGVAFGSPNAVSGLSFALPDFYFSHFTYGLSVYPLVPATILP